MAASFCGGARVSRSYSPNGGLCDPQIWYAECRRPVAQSGGLTLGFALRLELVV